MKMHGESEEQHAHLSWAPCVLYMHHFVMEKMSICLISDCFSKFECPFTP